MSLISVILVIVVVGLVLFIFNSIPTKSVALRNVINFIVAVVVLLWILKAFGFLNL